MAKVLLSCIGGWVSEIGIIFCLFDRRTEGETIRFGEVWESNQTFREEVDDGFLPKAARRETEKEIGKTNGKVWKSVVFTVILQGGSEREKESQRR